MPYYALTSETGYKTTVETLLRAYERVCSIATYDRADSLMRKLEAAITLINETHHDAELPKVASKIQELCGQLEEIRGYHEDDSKGVSRDRATKPTDRNKVKIALGEFIMVLTSAQGRINPLLPAELQQIEIKRASPPATPQAPTTHTAKTRLLNPNQSRSSSYGVVPTAEEKNILLLRESRTSFVPDYILRQTFEKGRYHCLAKRPFWKTIASYLFKEVTQFAVLLSLVIPGVYYVGKIGGLLSSSAWIWPTIEGAAIFSFVLMLGYLVYKYCRGELWELRTSADLPDSEKTRFQTTLSTTEPSALTSVTAQLSAARELLQKLVAKQKELVDQNGKNIDSARQAETACTNLASKLQTSMMKSEPLISARAVPAHGGASTILTAPLISTSITSEHKETPADKKLPPPPPRPTESILPGYYHLTDEKNPNFAINQALGAYQYLCSIAKRRTYPGLPGLLRKLEYTIQLLNQTHSADELPIVKAQITNLITALEEISRHNEGEEPAITDEHRALTATDRLKVIDTISEFKRILEGAQNKASHPTREPEFIRQNRITQIAESEIYQVLKKGKPHCVVKMSFWEAMKHYLKNKLVLMTFVTIISSIICIVYYASELAPLLYMSETWVLAISSAVFAVILAAYPLFLYLSGRLWEFVTPPDAIKAENLRFVELVSPISSAQITSMNTELVALRRQLSELQQQSDRLTSQNVNSDLLSTNITSLHSTLAQIERGQVTSDVTSARPSMLSTQALTTLPGLVSGRKPIDIFGDTVAGSSAPLSSSPLPPHPSLSVSISAANTSSLPSVATTGIHRMTTKFSTPTTAATSPVATNPRNLAATATSR
jgi:hypothetical protein